ncbi:MAG: prolyl oligopeptidase family serine peptidase [Bacteroidales bacterium]|nr:prolyl oligopeptidase family serine peptidase [Bacteroidales bacterium]
MKHLLIPLLFIFLFSCNQEEVKENDFNYPETAKDSTVDDYFGTNVEDPYRWLEDDNSDETKAWVTAQNEVTFGYLHKIPFRQKIIDRLTEIYNYERFSTPFKEAGKYFFYKNDGLQNQSVLYIQDDLNSEPKVLLDPNKLSEDGTVALSGIEISKDGKHLVYSISRGGSDWNEIYVKDIETSEILEDHIEWVKFSGITWFENGFFYSRFPETKEDEELTTANQNQKVYYHVLGTEQKDDKLIFENKEKPNRMYGVSLTDDDKYLFLYESETTSGNGLYVKDLSKPNSDFKRIAEGFESDYMPVDHINGKLLILTNDNAPKYKLVEIDVNDLLKENWKDIIPESENVLEDVSIGANKLIVSYMEDAKSKVFMYNFDGTGKTELTLPGIGTMTSFSSDKGEDIAFYSFTSYTVPSVIYKYSFKSEISEVYKKPDVKGLNFDEYVTKQVFYKSKDGTKIPMFITHKKDIKLDGTNPTLLYGYGGFNISLTPGFSISKMIWLENGGVYVVANLRGGGEYGEEWHKSGTLLQKQNVFDDFIAAAEYLIDKKYTSSDKLAVEGGSNGGLLIGAVTNQRPELFAVSLAHVGVMDMLRYQYFTIGRAWSSDYGLSEDSTMFNYLYKYSPLHNIKEGINYPATLVLTADHDDRVVPAHSFKYIATLQEKYSGNNPVIIRIETKAGHGAGKPIAKRIEQSADIFSFVYDNMGINPYKE